MDSRKTARARSQLHEDVNPLSEMSDVITAKLLTNIYIRPSILNVACNLKTFYLKKILVNISQTIQICSSTILQNNDEWEKERGLRITASRAYSLYTYTYNKSPDWDKKIKSFLDFRGFATTSMMYGCVTEALARKCYEEKMTCTVQQLGLIVNPEVPWLGYSPDGYVAKSDSLIEIKCPILGKTKNLSEVLPTLKYYNINTNSLNKNHSYYCQIQIGMAVFNCNNCDFIIYSKHENNCKIIKVNFDNEYFQTIVQRLEPIYFKNILPVLYKNIGL